MDAPHDRATTHDLARIAGERGIWLHVDGAYGGWGVLDERVRALFGDVAACDSFAIDPHKWLAAPVGTGAVIVRDPGLLARAFEIESGAHDRGRTVTSSTRVGGRFAIRPCFINPRSTLADADALVDEVLAVGRALAAAG